MTGRWQWPLRWLLVKSPLMCFWIFVDETLCAQIMSCFLIAAWFFTLRETTLWLLSCLWMTERDGPWCSMERTSNWTSAVRNLWWRKVQRATHARWRWCSISGSRRTKRGRFSWKFSRHASLTLPTRWWEHARIVQQSSSKPSQTITIRSSQRTKIICWQRCWLSVPNSISTLILRKSFSRTIAMPTSLCWKAWA